MSNPLTPTAEEALAEWARRVRANRDQAERVREGEAPADFYRSAATSFRADPRRTDEPVLEILRGLAQRHETWLDIGAGGGRYALPIALLAQEVIAVEPSEGMRAVLRESMADYGVPNVRIVPETWPTQTPVEADVALISHVGYDIEDFGPFLEAMERAAKRLCVAVFLERSPASAAEPFWPEVHGEPRELLPALREFIALQLARGRLCEVQLTSRQPLTYADREAPLGWLRTQLFVQPDSEKDQRVTAAVKSLMTERNGQWAVSWEGLALGVVTWEPPR
ncbi:MAG: class I SAM-dependent methyltransferase [Dehalococcoidia bacterium]|nr:class I SAM-dependent methyltransferase [Dehalococcoidia bacterium]